MAATVQKPNYEERLALRIREAGQEIIDRASEIAGATNSMRTGLDIHVHLGVGEDQIDTVEWTTEVINKNQLKRLNKGE